MNEGIPSNAPIYTPSALVACAMAFSEAVDAARSDVPWVLPRVDVAKLPVYYIILVHWGNVTTYASSKHLAWPLEPTKELAWAEFARVWKLAGVTSSNEFGCDLSCVQNQIFNHTV